eukprot:GHVT01099090.1.p1 GENE.GHVT01099090.1~~GHVT01099090.1.p1  ORF type:complete len:325 (-),score=71.65 GHVT01099090.1:203-1177(-)
MSHVLRPGSRLQPPAPGGRRLWMRHGSASSDQLSRSSGSSFVEDDYVSAASAAPSGEASPSEPANAVPSTESRAAKMGRKKHLKPAAPAASTGSARHPVSAAVCAPSSSSSSAGSGRLIPSPLLNRFMDVYQHVIDGRYSSKAALQNLTDVFESLACSLNPPPDFSSVGAPPCVSSSSCIDFPKFIELLFRILLHLCAWLGGSGSLAARRRVDFQRISSFIIAAAARVDACAARAGPQQTVSLAVAVDAAYGTAFQADLQLRRGQRGAQDTAAAHSGNVKPEPRIPQDPTCSEPGELQGAHKESIVLAVGTPPCCCLCHYRGEK